MSTFSERLKLARTSVGISQEQLGLDAGLDPASASTRMNRYETGMRVPDPDLVERIAGVLGVPAPFFYAVEDDLAELLLMWGKMREFDRVRILAYAHEMTD